MKQIRFKHLVTLGLCCSLLVNSITGITAIAETVTIESSPTVESSMKEETTKASTEESIKESTEKSTKESVEGSTVKSTAESMQESEESEQEEITKETTEERKQTEESSVVSPKQIQPIISNEDYYTAIQTELTNFVGRAQIYQDWSSTLPAGRMTFDITTPDAPSLNMTDFNLSADLKSLTRREYNSNLVDITSSKLSIAKTQNSLAIVVPEQTSSLPTTPARAYMNYLANIHLTVPKYVQSTSISGNVVSLVVNGRVGAANGPIENPRSQIVLSKLTTSSFEIHTDNDLLTNYYDTTNTSIGTVPGTFIWSVNRYGNANLENTVFMPKQASVITVALKKVTENFKDVNGTAIPAPTGFTQGKKTSITNNNYTFKQSGTLPETYKASNGKNYKFKGWYKGKTKPATLKTTKTPSYAVTYDNNDDLNVVYEVDTAKDYKFPSRTVNFQFVNEAGAILLPTPFTITTDLQQEINSTYTKLGSITGTNSGNTKQVTIPAKTIRADVSLGGVNNYGTTNTRITIPKFYENISLYTGNAYTQATFNQYSTVGNTLIGAPHNNAPLYYGLSKVTATQFKMNEFASGSNYMYSRLFVATNPYKLESYYTTVGTVYYQLTNRKVTENFVDTNGVKITAPTGFTQ
ncbi:WxL domain-containing protein, partial [Enterococcus faecalis]